MHHRLLVFAVLAALCAPAGAQSLLARATKKGVHQGLIDNLIASEIGDILTIVIKEEHKVKNEDKQDRATVTSLAASLESFNIKPDVFAGGLLPDLDVRSNRTFKGDAKQEKDSKFEAHIAVTVVDRLPNGNLVINGRRTVVVDDEEKLLNISGVIRQWDIAADNTIASSKVSEAKVSITGVGKNTEAVTRGPVGKILETAWWLIWPF